MLPMFESRLRRSLRWRGAFLLLAAAAVDLLSHGSKLEGHFCMHEDTTFTINNPPPHHTYLSLSLRHPGTNALRLAIQSPSSMIETNTIHLSLYLNPNHTPRHSLTPSVSLYHPILPPAQHIPPHLHLHLHPHLAVFARPPNTAPLHCQSCSTEPCPSLS